MYEPAHHLARQIFEALPPIPGLNTQAKYDEIVGYIEKLFGLILTLEGETETENPTVN